PARLLQLLAERGAAVSGAAPEDVRVDAIDADARKHGRIDRAGPLAAHLAHDHIWDDVAHPIVAVLRAGSRIELADQCQCMAQSVLVAVLDALQTSDLATCHERQVFARDAPGELAERRFGGERLQLKVET